MARDTQTGPAIGDTLPRTSVHTADGTLVLLRPSPHRATVLFFPHPRGCADCRAYLQRIDEAELLGAWSAALVTVVADPPTAERFSGGDRTVAVDTELRRRCGIPDDVAAVVVADRHGQVWERTLTSDHAKLPDAGQLAADVRFIAIQCPECDVPDVPGLGEWG